MNLLPNSLKILAFIVLGLFSQIASSVEDARNFDAVLTNLIADGDQLVRQYTPEHGIATSDGFSRLYFDQFESSGLEFRLAIAEPEQTARIELGFTGLIQLSLRGRAQKELSSQWQMLRSELQQIDTRNLNSETWLGNFFQALLILLREGVEAILLVALLVTFLTRAGHGDKTPLIWYGAGLAILASIALAYGLQYFIGNLGQTREMIEGLVLLSAALLLCYVSLWLLSQKESQQWQQFLHQRIEQELQHSNQLAVFLMAFIAVFREGAETILFYQALMLESQVFDQALWAGAITATGLLCGFYFGLNKIIRLIRLDYFFKTTAGLLFIMAIVFTGKGVMELQASGWLTATSIKGMLLIPSLGIFPTVEALSSQMAVIAVFLGIFAWIKFLPKRSEKL